MSEKRKAKKAAKIAKKEDKKAAKLARKEFKKAKHGKGTSVPDELELEGVQYIAEGSCGEDEYSDLVWKLDEEGNLLITGSGYMTDYSLDPHFSRPWGKYSSDIKTVFIDADVKYIGDFAFFGLDKLIGFGVDPENKYLAAVDGVLFSKDLTELIRYPVSGEVEYQVPDTVTHIDEYAFAGCLGLERVLLPDGVVSIGHHAFAFCPSLDEVSGGWGVTGIPDSAFEGCLSIASFETWPNVDTVGDYAFKGCINLKKIKLSRRVISVGVGIADGCELFDGFEVDEENPYFTAQDGILFNYFASMLISYPVTKTSVAYAVPHGVTDIGEYSFAGNTSLANVTLPRELNIIGRYSFAGCDSLDAPVIPDNVSYIGEFAF